MGLGKVGANPSLSDPTSHQTLRGGASKGWEDRESHQRDATNGWGRGRSVGSPIPTQYNLQGKWGRIARARSAQAHQPGGVAARVSGKCGTNPSLSDPTSHQTLRVGALKGGEDRESHPPEGKSGWRGGWV